MIGDGGVCVIFGSLLDGVMLECCRICRIISLRCRSGSGVEALVLLVFPSCNRSCVLEEGKRLADCLVVVVVVSWVLKGERLADCLIVVVVMWGLGSLVEVCGVVFWWSLGGRSNFFCCTSDWCWRS